MGTALGVEQMIKVSAMCLKKRHMHGALAGVPFALRQNLHNVWAMRPWRAVMTSPGGRDDT